MAHKLDKIEIASEYKHLQIREIKEDGGYHRKVLTCDMDISGEDSKIQEQAEKLWTNEVKDNWSEFKEEQEAEHQAQRAAQ
jgi:hypothetical protein